MDKLFTLYRYLARSQSSAYYAEALRAIESVLDMTAELESWGGIVQDFGDLDWRQVSEITKKAKEGHRIGLCVACGSSMQAIVDFAKESVSLQDYDVLIKLLQEQKEAALKLQQENSLGDLDDHPF